MVQYDIHIYEKDQLINVQINSPAGQTLRQVYLQDFEKEKGEEESDFF